MRDTDHTRRMHVLLSAYACEPGKGSEPGVGWRWTCGLAGRVKLVVATRANNRPAIEKEIQTRPTDDPLHRVRFVYHELPGVFLVLKRAHLLPTMAYYILWQWTLARVLRHEAEQADVIHHLTFCTPLCPGFWPDGKALRVIGPVGAPLVYPHYLPLFGKKRIIQQLRSSLMRRLLILPWLRRAFLNAAAVFPANSEAKELLESQGVTCQPVMLDTGAPNPPSNQQSQSTKHKAQSTAPQVLPISNHQLVRRSLGEAGSSISSRQAACHFLYAGVLERRKGLELTLRAFALVIRNQEAGIRSRNTEDREQLTEEVNHKAQGTKHKAQSTLTLLGTGPDRPRLEALVASLGIADHVHFPGSVPQAKVASHFAEADVFVFTSVRDTSGGVNLEAMATGLPILCIAHQGVGDITDDSCAIRIPPGPIPETIEALADGMQRLADDPDLRARLGQNARLRAASKFSWQEKFDRMVEVYGEVAR